MKASINILILFFNICAFSCKDHREEEPKYYITNLSKENVYLIEYNRGKAISKILHEVNETVTSSGGGILSIDSVKFHQNDTSSFVMYKPHRHDAFGYDSTMNRNIFNIANWEKKPINDYYYTILEEDFN